MGSEGTDSEKYPRSGVRDRVVGKIGADRRSDFRLVPPKPDNQRDNWSSLTASII